MDDLISEASIIGVDDGIRTRDLQGHNLFRTQSHETA
jgi:hypothetical protein